MKLPSKIKRLSAQDAFAAEQLAARGRVFSEIEEILWGYYYGVESLKTPNLPCEMRQGYESANAMYAETLCAIFTAAVTERNPEAISEVAEAVAYFKKQNLHKAPYADKDRTLLLCFKCVLERSGTKPSYTKLAEMCGSKLTDQFRRAVRQLNVPHKIESGGRPKKTPTDRHAKSLKRS